MLYLHRKDQEKTGKKMHISDEHFFKDAEKMIVEEISYVMDIPEQNVIDYIVGVSYTHLYGVYKLNK